MKFLRGLAVSLLSFLLFLSLAVFSTVFMMKSTLLNPDFVSAQVDKIPVFSVVKEITAEQFGGQLPAETKLLQETMYQVLSEQEPWLKEQIKAGIHSSYDFLLGKSERLSLTIPLAPLKEALKNRLWQTFQQNLPPQLSGLPPNMVAQYFEEYYRQFAGQIPSELKLDESLIPPDIMAQMLLVRQYISYVPPVYYGLIILMVVLVAGVILLNREIKGATRGLGITFLIYGALEYAGVWATRNFLPATLPLPNLPASLQPWFTGVMSDAVTPMQTLGIGLIAVGAALVIISVVYPGRRVEK